ncbi:protein FAM200A-like [Panulirus ornatus]|uniref:protein FAM200A-like n=1 Tax=Panulirus ornatus TaxID=150431 RepID=UPI003A846F70
MNPTERGVLRPFTTYLSEMKDDHPAKEELIDLQSSASLKAEFDRVCVNFWIKLTYSFPLLTLRAFKVLVLFVTTYLFESGSSGLAVMQTKAGNSLKDDEDMRVMLSSTAARIDKVDDSMNQQSSH